ncbi:MAG TPA: large conductance mechanosensitive channel protein MscL [Candidatus Saccharimonadales bacterium]|nr:large conductance mechanosensitive channel protein MscL [Candidatus Saccharimonadales bacterium]
MFKDFRKFILRGNTVDLAVAVVIGAAFNGVVTSLVKDMVTPLISAFYGKQQFSNSFFTFHTSKFMYGDFFNAVISFLLVSSIVFFFVVQPINKLLAYSSRNKEPGTRKCPECLSSIPIAATRCMYCTSKVTPTTKTAKAS